MIQRIKNWFSVEPTGESFWDYVNCEVVYTYKYKHNGKKFLARSKYSIHRVEIDQYEKSRDI